jgi:lysophospholipase L1-like esterase
VEQDVISLGPSRVIIQLGINDVIAAALDTDRAEHILSVAVRNTLLLIRLILDDDIAVIYSTIMPVSNLSVAERLLYKRDLNADVNEINRLILDQIPKEVIVLDAAGIIGETNAVRYKDSLHLTSDSYEVLNRALRKLLKDN